MISIGRVGGIVAVLATLASDGCPWRTTNLSPAERAANEYAVWSAAIDANVSSDFPVVVVDSATVRIDDWMFGPPDGVAGSLARDFESMNRRPAHVDAHRLTSSRVRLLDPHEANALAARGDTVFAHLNLSRPGFDADMTRAVVTVTVGCGMLCGGGGTMLLERKPGGRWTVARTLVRIEY